MVENDELNKKVKLKSQIMAANRKFRNELNKKVDFDAKYEYNIKYNIYGMVD